MSDLPLITGMGAALVDLFADVSDAELEALGSPKASMSLVEPDASSAMQEKVRVHTHQPGGSAANTIAGIAALGVRTGFVGKIADDRVDGRHHQVHVDCEHRVKHTHARAREREISPR